MGKLIDAGNLKPDTEWSEYYDTYMSYSQLQIREAEEVKAIRLEKIKQAKEEIKGISEEVPYRNQAFSYGIRICETEKVLEILDKLISESED